MLFVKKKSREVRLCCDYHKLNSAESVPSAVDCQGIDAMPGPEFHQTGPVGSLQFDPNQSGGVEDSLQDMLWPHRIHGDALWPDQCSWDLHALHAKCVLGSVGLFCGHLLG